MKVSLNWVKQYTKVNLPVDALVTKIGEQLGAVEEVVEFGKRYEGILIVKVVSSDKHPNADKLHVCLVDDGGKNKQVKRDTKGLIQIVCGAPNVTAGMLAAWIPPGATVPSTIGKDPFVIEAKELRGVVSNGMLASPKELALGDSHGGLLVVDKPAKPGDLFAKAYELDDYIIDIENKMFTHRPDCFGTLGVAREVAGITNQKFASPAWYSQKTRPAEGFGLEMDVKNDLPKLIPRFSAIAMKDITVGPSPLSVQVQLVKAGIRPINNVVDATNYIMLLTAQPVHAYDYDKVKTGILGARLSKKGEELKLLNGKTLKLNDGAVVITDGKKPIGLGGVMGGADTEVDDSTKNIIIECANFDMNLTRKTAMEYGLFTDAVTRFTKGQSPLQTTAVLAELTEKLEKITGGQVASQLVDVKSSSVADNPPVQVSTNFINERLGENLASDKIKLLLENVEFKVAAKGDNLAVTPPFWRTDIEIAEDVVEEVGRLYGYDKLPQILPKRSLIPAGADRLLAFKFQLRDILSGAGANEVLTYSFVNEKLLRSAGQDPAGSYHIKNALSPDLQYYRQSLLPSLLSKVEANSRGGFDEYLIYEIGLVHQQGLVDKDKLPIEFNRLAIVYAANYKNPAAAYYRVKLYVDYLLTERLGIKLRYEPLIGSKFSSEGQSAASAFWPEQSAVIYHQEEPVGIIGLPNSSLKQDLKLPGQTAQVELDLTSLFELAQTKVDYEPLNRFPSTDQDITLRAPAQLSHQELTNFIESQLDKAAMQDGYNFKLKTLDIYQKATDKNHKQTSWRVTLSHPERTLTTDEVNKLLESLALAARDKLKAERV